LRHSNELRTVASVWADAGIENAAAAITANISGAT